MAEINKGYMRVPNELWERLYKIRVPMQERRVFDYIYRQTLGYPGNPRKVSTYDITKVLGMLSCDVRDRIAELVKKKMVIRKGIFKEIQKDYKLWMVGEGSPTKREGKVALVGRGKIPSLVGEGSPLGKESLKRKRKESVLSNVTEKERRDEYKKHLANLIKNIGKLPEGKK